jgi:hypothetical protein
MAHPSRILRLRAHRISRRLGLLGRFSALSLVSLAALGLVLAHFFGVRIHDRALASSAQEADLITRFGITPQISGADLSQGLSAEAIAALNQLLHAGYSSYPVQEIRIWSADGRVVYCSDSRLIGKKLPIERDLAKALAGTTAPLIEVG